MEGDGWALVGAQRARGGMLVGKWSTEGCTEGWGCVEPAIWGAAPHAHRCFSVPPGGFPGGHTRLGVVEEAATGAGVLVTFPGPQNLEGGPSWHGGLCLPPRPLQLLEVAVDGGGHHASSGQGHLCRTDPHLDTALSWGLNPCTLTLYNTPSPRSPPPAAAPPRLALLPCPQPHTVPPPHHTPKPAPCPAQVRVLQSPPRRHFPCCVPPLASVPCPPPPRPDASLPPDARSSAAPAPEPCCGQHGPPRTPPPPTALPPLPPPR